MSKEKTKEKKNKVVVQSIPNNAAQTGYYPGSPYPQGYELARAYMPIQRLTQVYPPALALKNGTLFPELLRPYPN